MTIPETPALPDLRGVASWRKSTRSSGGGNGQCVEVACKDAVVGIRDSKNRSGATYPVLAVDASTWSGFIGEIKAVA
ncbi:DUF397 domain-containing protein [Phytomonospora endophytica]|uniref:DUF397 domain-containing protein n=1 Tax=Phytomonospora endophytica TaxID=714109 RepID=A0A841FLX8_9ACTN|nr:DUF397 domain-containing protein [Phytomonospora endophytica]MBB6033609.1 hypothetical protein [Phytomonospora endophytica]GIG64876.1 hypothetical protein Pen01_11710 [Phytomonospora endophytica]